MINNKIKKPVVLIILDGWGYREEKDNNAIAQAETPFFDYLWQTYDPTLLVASGSGVGLPDGQMGNSEVGHLTIGAGQVIDTDLVRINKAAAAGEFDLNPAFVKLFDHVKAFDSVLHVEGLLGPGGVHSHSDHLFAFLRSAKAAGITKIALHVFTDGRDLPPQSAHQYLAELEDLLAELGIGLIATASGRFYAMDRDNNWDRLERAEKAIFSGEGRIVKNQRPSAVLRELYEHGVVDEMLEPMIFLAEDDKSYRISENDGVFFFNFRTDRTKMMSQKILAQASKLNLCFVTMTEYDKNFDCLVAFPPVKISTTLAHQLSQAGLTQVHIAETEKFAHATYFLNGGETRPHPGEEHILINSYKDIKTHDQKPQMRAPEIADAVMAAVDRGYDFIFINFANADMIGHTANSSAIVTAVEEVDRQLKRVVEKVLTVGGVVLVTADHGNAEVNIDPVTGEKHTAHTTNLVPAILTTSDYGLHPGGLADVAPTILALFNLNRPEVMTGHSLLEVK